MEGASGDNNTPTSSNRKCSALTGSARKIKDNAADWHNLMLRWEKLNDEGFAIAGNIINMKLSRPEKEPQLLADDHASPQTAASQQAGGGEELQEECCKLQDIVEKMVAIVTKMQRLAASQRGILDLEEFQFGPEGRKVPLFHSWTAKQFCESMYTQARTHARTADCFVVLDEASQTLLDAFTEELRLKRTILQELAHTESRDLCTVYMSCWLHQPFVPPQTRLTLEALLLETGHRPL